MIREAVGRVADAGRRAASLLLNSGVILLYHRVTHLRPDPWSLAVTPEHFAEHLEILRRYCVPLPLLQLAAAVASGTVPDRAVAVTFDDGYADNLYTARPLLERQAIPATVFLSTGTLESGREFWWDELERVLLEPGTLPDVLALAIRGRRYSWVLGDAAHYDEAAAQDHGSWKAWQACPSERHRIFLRLRELMQPLTLTEQYEVRDQLLAWANQKAESRASYRSLSCEEVAALGGGLIEIGAHTVTHSALAHLPGAEQQWEIQQSKARIEDLLGRAVRSFSYPFGGRSHYTPESVRLVRDAGFTCACSSFDGTVTRFSSPFQLPRLYMEDMDGDRFAGLLSRWLHVRAS